MFNFNTLFNSCPGSCTYNALQRAGNTWKLKIAKSGYNGYCNALFNNDDCIIFGVVWVYDSVLQFKKLIQLMELLILPPLQLLDFIIYL